MLQVDREEFFEENNQKRMVNHPQHYNKGGIEVLDVIDAFNLNFNLGNAIKYILRSNFKGNKEQDLDKAMFYIKHELKGVQSENIKHESNTQASYGDRNDR